MNRIAAFILVGLGTLTLQADEKLIAQGKREGLWDTWEREICSHDT